MPTAFTPAIKWRGSLRFSVEYARQVNKNLDTKAEADPTVAGRKAAFLLKFKELRHTEVLKPTDLKKIRNAAIFGAIAGTGAGALMEHTQLGELIRERFSGNIPGLEGLKNIAGGAKDMAGGAWNGAGEMVGNAKDFAGTLPGVRGIGDAAGGAKDMVGNIPGVHGAGDLAGNVWHRAGETVDNAKHAVGLGGAHEAGQQAVQAPPEGFVPKADFNALQEHVTNQTQKIDDLQRQVDELKHATGVSGAVPGAGTAAAAGQAVTEQAVSNAQATLDHLGNSIPLQAGSNPWDMSTNILKQMGVNPTPEQIMQLDKVLSQENGISVPEWGIKGTIDAHSLPVGFKLNLTDTVKKAALGIASKK